MKSLKLLRNKEKIFNKFFKSLLYSFLFIIAGANQSLSAEPPNALFQDYNTNNINIVITPSFFPIVFWDINKFGIVPNASNAKTCTSSCPHVAISAGADTYKYHMTNKDGLMVVYYDGAGKAIGYGLDLDQDGYGNNQDDDIDGDGVLNHLDDFPNDAQEWSDSDGDGVGNNSDVFPFNANEWIDSDGDGYGNNSDVFPNDSSEWSDVNGNGIGDNFDAIPENLNHKIRTPLQGEFSVDNSGAANYRIPFDLPPGINGFQPELGLNYNSSKRRGSIRMGWSISGLSAITRCPAKSVKDGIVYASSFDAGEKQRFCLDGKPLVLIPGGSNGVYGADGTLYVTEIRSDLLIKAIGQSGNGPNYFEVKSGDGQKKIYGMEATSKYKTNYMAYQDCCDFGSGSKAKSYGIDEIYSWKLDSIEDRNGNKISYKYHPSTSNIDRNIYSQLYLVRYDGNLEGGQFDVEIEFDWEDSQQIRFWDTRVIGENSSIYQNLAYKDIPFGTMANDGLVSTLDSRLNKVTVKVGKDWAAHPTLKEYLLKYNDAQPDNSRGDPPISNLSSIQECIKGNCSHPVTLDWEYKYQGDATSSQCPKDNQNFTGGEPALSATYKTSVPFVKNYGWVSGNYHSQVVGDFNNDDLVDVAVFYTYKDSNKSRMKVDVAYSNGNGQFIPSPGVTYYADIGSPILNHRLTGDFNNDGYTDLVATNSSASGWNVYTVLNQGNGSFAQPLHQKVSSVSFIDDESFQKTTGDFNGDGNLDLLAFGIGHGSSKNDQLFSRVDGFVAYVALGNGDGTFNSAQGRKIATRQQIALSYARDRNLFTGDFNGDGITDIASTNFSGEINTNIFSGSETIISFADFNGVFSAPIIEKKPAASVIHPYVRVSRPDYNDVGAIQTTDVNGDGLTDFVFSNGNYGGILPKDAYDTGQLVYANPDFGRNEIVSLINNGNGTFKHVVYEDIMAWSVLNTVYESSCKRTLNSLIVSDFNKDGFSDLSFGSGQFFLGLGDGKYLKQGNRYITGDNVAGTGGGMTSGSFIIPDTTYGSYAFDVNRDGNPDAVEVVVDSNGLKIGTNAYAENISQQYLTKIIDGYGRQIDIDYEAIASGNSYTKRANAQYPIKDVSAGMTVVDDVKFSDGIGGTYSLDYQYSGLKADLDRQEMLGFEKLSITDSRNNITTTSNFETSFPISGQLVVQEEHLGDNTLIKRSVYAPTFIQHTNHIGNYDYTWYSIRNGSESITQYNHDGALIGNQNKTFSNFDIFGNPSTISSNSSDGYSSTQTNDILNSTDWNNYYIGRITSSTETRSGNDFQDTITRTKEYDYYPNGLLHFETVEPYDTDLYLRTTYQYDSYGRVTQKTETGNPAATHPVATRTESIQYLMPNAISEEMEIITADAENHVTHDFYDVSFGHITRSIDKNDLETSYIYDTSGEILKITNPDSINTTFTKDYCDLHCPPYAAYRLFTKTTGQAFKEEYFDIYDRVVRVRSPAFDSRTIYQDAIFNQLGQKVYTSEPYFTSDGPSLVSEFWYDAMGRMEQSITPESGSIFYTHTALNGQGVRISKSSNRLGINGTDSIDTVEEQNLAGNLIRSKTADQHSTLYKYDAYGNLKSTIDPLLNSVTVNYDALGRVTSLDDPDLGLRTFGVDAFGQIRNKQDENNNQVTISYDRLGRIRARVKPEGSDIWAYDTGPNAIGKLVSETSTSGSTKTILYDSFGRVGEEIHQIAGTSYSINYDYDNASRLSQVTYPTGFAVSYGYTSAGILNRVFNGNTTYWMLDELNAKSERIFETFGNGVTTTTGYNGQSGRIETILSENFGSTVQNLRFTFDTFGNLDSREDIERSLVERFTYDVNNRLTDVLLNNTLTRQHSYNEIGNIISKSDFGSNYQYGHGNAGPHAVTRLTDTSNNQITYQYDDNGNMINGNGKVINYTSFDKPLQISTTSSVEGFEYDANQARVRKTKGSDITTYINPRWDVGIHYEKEEANGNTNHKHYINAGDIPIAIYQTNTNGSSAQISYLHKDHLGSVTTITNQSGTVIEYLSYKAFGDRRNSDWSDATTLLTSNVTHHGFTGHEHLDESGLVHMNARLYDPKLGRFLSADTVVPSIKNNEAFNRYTYVYNNPLSLTDASGNSPGYGSRAGYFFGKYLSSFINRINTTMSNLGLDYSETQHNSTMSGISQTPDSSSSGMSGEMLSGVENFTKQYFNNFSKNYWEGKNGSFQQSLSGASGWEHNNPFTIDDTPAGHTGADLANNPVAIAMIGVLTRSKAPKSAGGAANSAQGALLKEHLRQADKYGRGGIKELQNGRIRYYGESVAPRKQGEMAGWRTVREWNPATGQKRTWHETLDHSGNVRQVRPVTDGPKTHYTFDKNGNYTGGW